MAMDSCLTAIMRESMFKEQKFQKKWKDCGGPTCYAAASDNCAPLISYLSGAKHSNFYGMLVGVLQVQAKSADIGQIRPT